MTPAAIITELCAAPLVCVQLTGRGQEASFISLSRATAQHLSQAIELERHRKRPSYFFIACVQFIHETLAPTFAAHPGITVADACSLLKHAQEAA